MGSASDYLRVRKGEDEALKTTGPLGLVYAVTFAGPLPPGDPKGLRPFCGRGRPHPDLGRERAGF